MIRSRSLDVKVGCHRWVAYFSAVPCRGKSWRGSCRAPRGKATRDAHRAFAEACKGAFGMDGDYAMLRKLYGAPADNPDSRYSPAQCIGIRTGILSGNPDRQHISTSFVERQNLNLRMGSQALHSPYECVLSKARKNHCHKVAIYHASNNFCRVQQTLKVTPAMEIDLTDHPRSLEEWDYWKRRPLRQQHERSFRIPLFRSWVVAFRAVCRAQSSWRQQGEG